MRLSKSEALMSVETDRERPDPLEVELHRSLEQLCRVIEGSGRAHKLAAIGLVTTDDVLTIAASLRFEGDFPSDAEAYRLLSPVEWEHSDEESFRNLNGHLAATRPPEGESELD